MNSHSNTEQKLKLNLNIWREGHYLPNGKIELRVADKDRITQAECNERLKSQFPTFIDFLNWCFRQDINIGGGLYLRGLTSAKGLVLPTTIGGGLYLRGEVRQELNQNK